MNYNPLRQPAPIVLAVGAVFGLILGLLIGWVFWPVEWTGATLRDLYPQEKAEYIAAVADAYVIYDNQEAREVAQRRLAQLDDGALQQSFDDAIQYFRDSQFSDRAIRDSNIRRLAVALNLSPPTTDGAAQVLPTTDAAVTTAPATPVPAVESADSLGWLGWLLWLATALLLLAGGIYLLSKAGLPDFPSLLKPRPKATDERIDEFDEPTVQQRRRSPLAALTSRNEPGVDYSFDQEDDEWQPIAPSVAGQIRRNPPQSSAEGERNRRATTNIYANDDDFADESYDDRFEDDGYDDPALARNPFDDEDEEGEQWRSARQSYTIDLSEEGDASPTNPVQYAAPSSPMPHPRQPGGEDERDQTAEGDHRAKAVLSPVAPAGRDQSSHRADATRGGRTPSPTRVRNKVIDQHIFHYRIGMAEYDESRPIVDPQSGRYIGEFGMGASSKNALAQTGADQLVALEVWLFDKSDERNFGNQTRILLSEYAVDHNLEQMFLKERQDNPRPFTAQPGIHFQLESENLLLDCTIVDVEYSASHATQGIFQEITVDMTVQQKGGK